MGQLLSVLPVQPWSELTSETETPRDDAPEVISSDATNGHTLPESTVRVPQRPPPRTIRLNRSPFPWRLVDARAFIYKGVIRVVRIDDYQDMDTVAISYTWSEDMRKWREKIVQMGNGRTYEDKILRGSASLSEALATGSGGFDANNADWASFTRAHLFFTTVALMVFTRGKKYFWMDILCINQDEMEEKKFFVPRMGILYGNTCETHAYPFGAEIAPSVMHESVQNPIWETRAWTVQEQILAKSVLFCYLFQGDVMDDIRKVAEHKMPDEQMVDRQLDTPVLDHFRYDRGIYVLKRGDHIVTCHMEPEGPFGNHSTSVMSRMADNLGTSDIAEANRQWDIVRRITSRSTMYKQITAIRESGNPAMKARLCLGMLPRRNAKYIEDMIYSALGTFDMEEFVPEYEIGFEEARLHVFEAMGPTVLEHLLGLDWVSNQDSDHRDTALPRIVGGEPTLAATYLQSSILECKYDRTIGTKLRCRTEKWRIWKPAMEILSMTALTRYVLGNDQLIVVQGSRRDCGQGPLIQPSASQGIPPGNQSDVKNIVMHSSLIGISDEELEETQHFEHVLEFIEVGRCDNVELVTPVGTGSGIALLALCIHPLELEKRRNMGVVLIADLGAFSSEFVDVVIE